MLDYHNVLQYTVLSADTLEMIRVKEKYETIERSHGMSINDPAYQRLVAKTVAGLKARRERSRQNHR